MVRKRSPDRSAESPRIDDLKLINGIGPAVEKRLNAIGIFTFAQLAALSPADVAAALADLIGLSSEHIIKQDWIGKAHKLAEESTSSEAQKDFEPVAEPSASKEEHDRAGLVLEEPLQANILAMESISSETQEEIETPKDSDQVATFTATVEQMSPIEDAHAATLTAESQKDIKTMASKGQFHPATFTVELLLDEDNEVYSTYVMHVQSNREQTWMGWEKTQLVDFLDQSIVVKVTPEVPVLANAEEPEYAPAVVVESTPLTTYPELVGTLHLRDLMIIGAESAGPRRILSRDQPFDVHLTLDLTEMTVPDNTPLNYKASIYGKSLGSRSGQVVGEVEGTVKPADTVTINVEGTPLAEGTYKLAATVIVALPGTKLTIKPGTTASIGDVLQVY